MAKDFHLTQMYMPFYAACVATTIGFFFFFLSFSSPYWLQSYSRVHSNFLHMGIWSVCFDKFVHPLDYHANMLSGCYWIFDRFFFKIGIWQWLDPYWLIAVQVLVTVAFITQCCVILILILYHLLFGHPAAESTMAMGGQLFIAVLLTLSVITFAIKSQDRSWMPRPDQNFLSWSFGFALLAAISSYIAAGFLYCVSYTDRAAQEEVERFEAVEHQYGLPSMLSGKMASGSVYGRSLYGGSQSAGGVVVKVPSSGSRPEQVLTLGSNLRPMDGGEGTASLFTPSLINNSRPRLNAPLTTVMEDYGDDQQQPRQALLSSQDDPRFAPASDDGSQEPIYTNERMSEFRTPRRGFQQTYSPLEESVTEDVSSAGSERRSQPYARSSTGPRGRQYY